VVTFLVLLRFTLYWFMPWLVRLLVWLRSLFLYAVYVFGLRVGWFPTPRLRWLPVVTFHSCLVHVCVADLVYVTLRCGYVCPVGCYHLPYVTLLVRSWLRSLLLLRLLVSFPGSGFWFVCCGLFTALVYVAGFVVVILRGLVTFGLVPFGCSYGLRLVGYVVYRLVWFGLRLVGWFIAFVHVWLVTVVYVGLRWLRLVPVVRFGSLRYRSAFVVVC